MFRDGWDGWSMTFPKAPPIRPDLSPRFPEKKETLSLDDGFDQTPVLKEISGHYNSHPKPSAEIFSDSLSLLSPWASQISPTLTTYSTTAYKRKLRTAYSKIAPAVVSVSSFVGLERKIECSGLIIDWRSSENEATILTSARLLLSLKNSELEFHIIVRMVDGTLLLAKEDRVDYYYNLLTLKVKSAVELSIVDLKSRQADIVEGMDVIALGRSFNGYTLCEYSGKLYLDYPSFGCDELLTSTCHTSEICEGGPLINDTGYVVGVNFFYRVAHPLPISVIIACLEMWRSASTILRPWVGMRVVDANQLSYITMEKSNMSLEDSYVVVTKVYGGSLAEKNNVCPGDLVATLNGTLIRSAKQYSQLFLSETARVACGDSGQQKFTVVINAFNRRIDNICIEADYVSVEDKRFFDSWLRLEDNQWQSRKSGSQTSSPCFGRMQ